MASYPLTQTQLGIFLDCISHPGRQLYHIPLLAKMPEGTDPDRLADAIATALAAHSAFSARISQDNDGAPVWTEGDTPAVESISMDEDELLDNRNLLLPDFNIDGGPLSKAMVISTDNGVYLFIDIHHIIFDGFSRNILIEDIDNAYAGNPVREERCSIFRLSEKEEEMRSTPLFREAEAANLALLEGAETDLEILPDIQGVVQEAGHAFMKARINISEESYRKFCSSFGMPQSVPATAAFAILLQSLCRKDDVCFATIYHGRKDPEADRTISMMVKTLPVRATIQKNTTTGSLMLSLKDSLKTARDNDLFSFAEIAGATGISSDILFAFQGNFITMPPLLGNVPEEIPFQTVQAGSKLALNLFYGDGGMELHIDYRSDLFSSAMMRTLASSFATILASLISEDSDTEVSRLPLMSAADEETILSMSSGGASMADPQSTIPSLFMETASRFPDKAAVVFRGRTLSYRELDRITNSLAHYLHDECGVGHGSRVGVMIGRSELMEIFPLAVMKAGAAYMPLDPHFPEDRLMFMTEDAGVGIILSDNGLAESVIPGYTGKIIEASILDSLPEDTLPICLASADSPMVVLYTSGSTGKPKGVTLTQHNIVNYCSSFIPLTGMNPEDRLGAFSAFGFDACMGDLYPSVISGATLYILDDETRMDLTAMYDFIESNGITVMFMTTQLAWQMVTLFDFSTIRLFGCGGEKLPPLEPRPYRFMNVYGPTECSVMATAFEVTEPTDGRIIGRPIPGYDVRILDSSLRLMPQGLPGEIVIVGDAVALGYLNRPELTASKFITLGGKRAYRTGDQGRYTADGEIEFLGRMDGLVKLRGLRIELGEIEATAAAHPAVKVFVAAIKEIGGVENLAGYYTVKEGCTLEPDDLQKFMASSLTEFMVPSVIMHIDEMPLTPNGKVDRRALPVPEVALTETVAPSNDTERQVMDIVAGIIKNKNFGVTTNLLSVGLTSLLTMRLVAAIVKEMGQKITAKRVMSAPTVREIAEALIPAGNSGNEARPVAKRKYYPLTENQKGVYIDWERNHDALQYNIPQAYCLGSGIDTDRLREALAAAIAAHPNILTRLTMRNGDVVQMPSGISPEIYVTELDRMPDAEFFQNLVRPFHLIDSPLFRCEIFTYGQDTYLFMDVHHIIFDGVSVMVLNHDIKEAYLGNTPQPETYTALDNAIHENELLESDEADSAREWFDNLIGESESTGYPRSAITDSGIPGAMGRVRMRIPAGEIRKFCARAGVTPSNYMLSAFTQLLHRTTREETVQITTVNNGRGDERLLNDTGMFVKTLPVVSRIKRPDITPEAAAKSIQQQFITTQEYDFFPFTDLVERKGVRPDIMYVFEGGINIGDGEDTDFRMESIPLHLDTAKVPLTLLVFEPAAEEYELVCEYDRSMYSEADMQVLLEMMCALGTSLPEAATIAEGRMTGERQEQKLASIRDGKRVDVPYTSFAGTMEMRVDENPDAKALVACDKTLSYREFDEECNRIANALIRRGVRRGDRIVILLPRRSYLITAIYGAMKTGAAYIPCDPDYPADRIRHITQDSGARFIVTDAENMVRYPGQALDIVELLKEDDASRPAVETGPEDVAYMIYTSGSTGRPKGVMIPQKAICNYFYGYHDKFFRNHPEVKTEMLIVTISFDASLNNLALALTSGHTLVLANEDECKDVVLLSRLMLDNAVDAADLTPSRLDAMLDLPEFREAVSRMSHLNIGGEGLPHSLIEKLYEAGFNGVCVNEYGPTETTVGSNHAIVTPDKPVTAGVPFYNDTQHIVDTWGSELPVGAVGELYISGLGLGLGYNNMPEKTAEAYVDFKGTRAYRTGDLAKWTPDGEIVILGRIDHQVKLRGLRIELGEIEAVAMKFPGIGKACADVREIDKVQHLCLYYTQTASVDKEALRKHLASTLTDYMVPDAFCLVEEMPLTPNGKTNRKALPTPELAPLTPYVEPETEMEKEVARIFSRILKRENIGANDDFFSIGGSSITAIKVVASLASSGRKITYKNVFDLRTPRGIAGFLDGKGHGPQETMPETETPESVDHEFDDVLSKNNLHTFLGGDPLPLGNVLLTGATGFMGIHMLCDLIMHTESNVTCIIRGKDGISPEERLRTMLFYYFDNTFDAEFESGRISVKEGEVTSPVPEEIDGLGIQTVINCAANVKHFSAGNDIEMVNVESVRNLVDFCQRSGARLVHVSTVSVAGQSLNGYPDPAVMMTEKMLDFGQSLDNQYVHSKFEAEKLILSAVSENRITAKIMRVGNLSPRARDGEFQINFRTNAFMGSLRAYSLLGCAPYPALDAPCEFSPIDEVCRAIVLLSSTPAGMSVFIPCNNHRLPLGDVLHILGEEGHPVKPVEMDDFMKCRADAMADDRKVTALQPLMAYDSDETSRTAFIRYDSTLTNQILYRLGFRWNYTSHGYVSRFIKAIDSLDFFNLI